jgi:hypothetical protein
MAVATQLDMQALPNATKYDAKPAAILLTGGQRLRRNL